VRAISERTSLKTALTIGNFDAVHRGHCALIETARASVGSDGVVEVWSFDPSPVTLLNPSFHLERLTTFARRKQLLLHSGADIVQQITPTTHLLAQTPEQFIADVVARSSPDIIVEGYGFKFGKNRAGDAGTLRTLGKQAGFSLIEMDGVEVTLSDATKVRASSSRVRDLLAEGRVEDAKIMLGRGYSVSGNVTRGDRRGREIGIPTANLPEVETMLPKDGIYAGTAEVDGEMYIAAISVGTKPTFGEHARVFEAHLIAFDGDLEHYEWPLTVTITHRIREQIRFDSVDDLRLQINEDIQSAITLIESTT
jgi:riboflavin kinase/FMN adenylyltransferase